MKHFLLSIVLIGLGMVSCAQVRNEPMPRDPRNNNNQQQNQTKDSTGFQQRDDLADSITISYRYLESLRRYNIDSSINDFDTYFPVPSSWQYLGNNGAAAFPLIFQPYNKAGWDPGFHAFDLYQFGVAETKFYKTTRPFSLLGYELAAGKEQMIQAQHTQNINPTFNAGFDYRLINAPGLFINQNNNHNSVRLFSSYQGKRKRYAAFFVITSNTTRAAENGGIINDSFLLSPNFKDRFGIDVNLGNAAQYSQNPFSTTVRTGNIYKNATIFLQQSYDVGRKDSIAINDSTTEYLFYPRLRFQHGITYKSASYNFKDASPDSLYYERVYGLTLPRDSTVFLQDKWKFLENDFSIIQFPDAKNPGQFLKLGAALQNINCTADSTAYAFYNLRLHGEYRNRTRNKKWEILLKGEFYLNGFNAGDYHAEGNLNRYLNKRFGDVKLFFTNTNRTPSFIYDERSSFNPGNQPSFNKENITSFGATANNPFVSLSFANHLISNYAYFVDYFKTAQYSKLINVVQLSASKKIKVTKKINWYLEATLQQTDAASPIRVPLFYTRSRLAFEGNYFKNLNLSTGLEVRYFSPYKANNYAGVVGQFVPQDSLTISNLPDVNAFMHFRIKTFTGFVRLENLNTLYLKDGFSFVNNNFAAPLIPTPGMMLRLGIKWWFVN